jgi:putative transposase
LTDLNPTAARNSDEGLEEIATVHQLRVPDQLRRTLSCTNVIEPAFFIVEAVCCDVQGRRPGNQIERWVGSRLLVAKRQFRKIIGHHYIPPLLSLAKAVLNKSIGPVASLQDCFFDLSG